MKCKLCFDSIEVFVRVVRGGRTLYETSSMSKAEEFCKNHWIKDSALMSTMWVYRCKVCGYEQVRGERPFLSGCK